MIAYLTDGKKLQGPFMHMVTGYRAERLELERSDIRTMLLMWKQDPGALRRCLLQLEMRFPIDMSELRDDND